MFKEVLSQDLFGIPRTVSVIFVHLGFFIWVFLSTITGVNHLIGRNTLITGVNHLFSGTLSSHG
jgi:hypothetical protein